jgi:prephenate dehydratase
MDPGTHVGYQGVPGAYSEEALLSFAPEAEAISFHTLPDLFAALESGEIERAFVPVENSHAGSVVEAYDLMLDHPSTVLAEWIHPIHPSLPPENMETSPDNATRYFLLEQGAWEPGRTVRSEGAGKTSIVFAVAHQPGALVRALSSFSRQHVNLARLESRPSRRESWEYLFFTDLEGYEDEPPVHAALTEMRRLNPYARILGSFPAAR